VFYYNCYEEEIYTFISVVLTITESNMHYLKKCVKFKFKSNQLGYSLHNNEHNLIRLHIKRYL